MKTELEEILKHLRSISNEMHDRGYMFQGVTESIAEWNFGYSEGLDYAIEKIELLIKK